MEKIRGCVHATAKIISVEIVADWAAFENYVFHYSIFFIKNASI